VGNRRRRSELMAKNKRRRRRRSRLANWNVRVTGEVED